MTGSQISAQQITGLSAGLEPILDKIEQGVQSKALAVSLPLVGNALTAAFNAGTTALQAYNTLDQDITAALAVFTDPLGTTVAALQKAINDAIAKAGFAGVAQVALNTAGTLTLSLDDTESATYQQALGGNFGLASMPLTTSGTATATVGFTLDLAASVDTAGDFSIAAPSGTALALSLNVAAPSFAADASLGYLNFHATDIGSSLAGNFAINTAGTATFSGAANLDVHLESDLGSAGLPSISANLQGGMVVQRQCRGPVQYLCVRQPADHRLQQCQRRPRQFRRQLPEAHPRQDRAGSEASQRGDGGFQYRADFPGIAAAESHQPAGRCRRIRCQRPGFEGRQDYAD